MKQIKRKKLSSALVSVLGAGVAFTVVATAANAQQAQRVEKIEVTGSNIKRVDVEGPAPVEIITKQQIQRTGASNVNELLRSLPSIDIFDQGELASNSPSGSGSSNIRMRGLSENNLLVLLNGKRLPVNALYDASGAGAAVNINMIPISAIERIEILKDGGSAIYGADAVAGVVNFITKKDYQGAEVTVGYGRSSRNDGAEKTFNAATGFGDLDKNRYNVLAAFDLFRRDPILRKDRALTSSVDFRRFGANDGRSSFSPYGNIVNNNGAFTGATVKPCPPQLYNLRCRYDFNESLLTAYNGADRWSGLLVGTVALTRDIKAYAQYMYSKSKDHFEAHPVPDFFVLPDGRFYAGRFMQGGPRITDRDSTSDQLVFGINGSHNRIDWDFSAGTGKNKVTNKDKNYYNANLWFPALESGALDATVATNNAAFVESLKVTPVRAGESKTSFVDLKVSGELFEMRAGPFAYAVGASYWRDQLSDRPDQLTQQGLVVGSIQQSAVAAKRNAKAVFGEVNVPLPGNVEVQGALRWDSYPGESRTTPKVAVKWTPTKTVLLRASYAEAFRVPSLKQLYGSSEQGAITIESETECAAIGQPFPCAIPAYQVQGANPNLKSEKGRTYNLGFVLDTGVFSTSVDWFRIEKKDDISQPTILTALQNGFTGRDPTNNRLLVFTNLQNFAEAQTQGFDVDARVRVGATPVGNLLLQNNATYYQFIRTRAVGEEWGYFQRTYGALTPSFRNVFTATLETGPWAFTAFHRFVGGFWDTDQPSTASVPRPATVRRVGGHEEIDAQVSFMGIKRMRLDLGVKNLLDREPPFSRTNAGSNAYTQMGFAEFYTSRGRFYYGAIRYEFK
jgi:iron complex outermembrane receptor protein